MLPPDGGKPRPLGASEVLMSGLRGGRFSYVAQDDSYLRSGWLDRWNDPSRLPVLVRIEVDGPTGSGIWPELEVPIRQGPLAVNVRALAMPLMAKARL
jgi:general secretion pathway protein J